MLISTFASSEKDIQACRATETVREVLLEASSFAREGRLTVPALVELNSIAQSHNLRTVLVWDNLMTERDFAKSSEELANLNLTLFSAVRVQCFGAARFLRTYYPKVRIQFIAETGFNNLAALKVLTEQLGTQLERMILSLQLPAEKLSEYISRLHLETEILGIGRILLFHSRRKLLAPNVPGIMNEWKEAFASSEDSHSREFPVIDNANGTLLFLDKDQFLFHRLSDFHGHLPSYLRVDLRHLSEFPRSAMNIEQIVPDALSHPEELRERWPRPTRAPFFKTNQTTKQFRFLGSETRSERGEFCVAEVVGTQRGKHTVARSIERFSLPGNFVALDPNGSRVPCEFPSVKGLDGQTLVEVAENQLIVLPFIKRISTGSLLLRS